VTTGGAVVVGGGDCEGVEPVGFPGGAAPPRGDDAAEPEGVDADAPAAVVVDGNGAVATPLVVDPVAVPGEDDDRAVPSSIGWVGLSPHAVASTAIAMTPAAMVVPARPIGRRR